MTTAEAHSCLLNMHMTFDLTEIEEVMPQRARKQLEAELETSYCSLGGVHCLYTTVFGQSSPVQCSLQSSPFQNPGFTETRSLGRETA